MTTSSGLFNERFAQNFIPKPASNDLALGSCPPDFALPQVGGGTVRLSSYRGQQPVVIAFTRIFTEKLFCPFCYPHIQDLKDRYVEIRDLGAELLMVTSTDSVQSAAVVADLELPYPLLYDPECKVFQDYGVGQALGAPLPGQFIVDGQGLLRYKHLFTFRDPNAATDEVLQVLRQGLTSGWEGTAASVGIPFL